MGSSVPPITAADVFDQQACLLMNAVNECLFECDRRFWNSLVVQPAYAGRMRKPAFCRSAKNNLPRRYH
jgi:hypothetical protein